MKKIISLIISSFMVLSVVGCSSQQASSAKTVFTNPGTYSCTVDGRNGDLTVTAEFSKSEIVSITTESVETESIGVVAMDTLTDTILENQSVAVDTIASATITCEAYMKALLNCIEQAGGDLSLLGGEIAVNTVDYKIEADVIVIGGGAAGMTAAVTMANQGIDVVLIEKSNTLGGNTVCSANGINAFDSDVQKNDEAYIAADTSREGIIALHTNDLNKDSLTLVETFVDNSASVINYFSSLGVEFNAEIKEDSRNSAQNYYMLKANADGSTALTMTNAIRKALEATDVTVYTNVDATTLVQNSDGTVTGVIAATKQGDVTFTGKAILICTGGFGQDNDLVAKYNPSLKGAITDEICPTTGEGLIMAQAVGADAVDLDKIQTFPVVVKGYGMVTPNKLPGGFPLNGTIIVNNSGERFTAEGFEIGSAILSQDNGEAYMIFGENNYNDWMKWLADAGFVVCADTAEELAEKLGIDAEGLSATISKWNEDARTGNDTVFGKENISAFQGTLYGFKYGVGAHYFMGGILINENTQVLDTDGNVIDGLYAAGEVTGGLHGSQRVDGTGLGDSFVMGYVAGNYLTQNIG